MDTENTQPTYAHACPECGEPLQTLWDYPSNEVQCPHCGNRVVQFVSETRCHDRQPDSLRGFRVLLLDADLTQRDLLAHRLASLGYQVTPVCHPRQMLEAASFQHFDLVMLGWSGRDHEPATLAKYLRRQMGPVPILVYSRHQPPNSTSLADGADGVDGITWVQVSRSDLALLESKLEDLIDDLMGNARPNSKQSLVRLASTE